MRRSYFLIAVLLVIVTGTAACAGDAEPNEGKPEFKQVTLSLRHTQIKETSQARLRVLEDVVAKTEAENEGVTFQLEGIDEIVNRDTKLKQEMAAGNPPDIFEVFGGADLKLYVKAGRMLDLTPILEELDLTDKFESLSEFTIDGRVYGVPYGGYSEGIFYNKTIFEELGLAIPNTWDELLDTAEAIKASGYVPFGLAAKDAWATGMMWNTIMVRYVGIDAFNGLLTGETKWTDPGFIQGFEAYAELIAKNYFPKGALGLEYAEQGSQLLRGKAAMVFTGTWDMSHFTSVEAGNLRGQIGFFSFPSIPGGLGDQGSINASYSNGFGFYSNLSPDQIEVVKIFIANFFNEEVQKRAMNEDKLLPSMKFTDLTGTDPIMNEVLTVMSQASSTWPAFDAIVQPSVTSEIGVGLQKLIGKLSTPEKVAQSIQEVQDKANKAQVNKTGLGHTAANDSLSVNDSQ
ncbi:extracellular solute-binding protein [Paenibacillus sp. LHD-117]|uniref:ABC transporter substrate-binding protein n=1 Tax=Paenibacillus sp. LHD-117 TaxID=3071412 RepID=UPI0027E00068|nr:extracellular solute-binding protein [Paenibacillus sp. LHD-117]MDQ6418356.1 extracellular solute-binding protein [Paenibacillus sp. LHD-117]